MIKKISFYLSWQKYPRPAKHGSSVYDFESRLRVKIIDGTTFITLLKDAKQISKSFLSRIISGIRPVILTTIPGSVSRLTAYERQVM